MGLPHFTIQKKYRGQGLKFALYTGNGCQKVNTFQNKLVKTFTHWNEYSELHIKGLRQGHHYL